MRLIPLAISLILGSTLLTGCSAGGGKGFANENDKLREQVMALESEIKTLKGRNSELQSQLAQMSRAPASVPEEVASNTPHIASISLSRLSQARDEDGDGKLDSILLFLEPEDGLGRFMQIVGSVSMHAAILPADGPAKTIGQATIGPAALRDGYRSAFTGQYYSLTLEIDAPPTTPAPIVPPPPSTRGATPTTAPAKPPTPASDAAAAQNQCTVRVEFTDGYTGKKFSTERVIDLQ